MHLIAVHTWYSPNFFEDLKFAEFKYLRKTNYTVCFYYQYQDNCVMFITSLYSYCFTHCIISLQEQKNKLRSNLGRLVNIGQ